MQNRNFGLLVFSSTYEKTFDMAVRLLIYEDQDQAKPLSGSAIGGGFALPDKGPFICRRVYACGVLMTVKLEELTQEQMARCMSDEFEDEWW